VKVLCNLPLQVAYCKANIKLGVNGVKRTRMKTSTLLRFLTIFIFILLIAIFVSYRSGAFSDDNIEPVISVIDTSGRSKTLASDKLPVVIRDSITKVNSSAKLDTSALVDSIAAKRKGSLMSSSKSIIVAPEDQPSKRKKRLMESTKLGRIFPPTGNSIKPKKDTVVLLKEKQ
jgi:hypothetical protein